MSTSRTGHQVEIDDTSSTLVIAPDDPRADDIVELLEAHLGLMHDLSPAEHVHALDVAGLLDESVTFLSARKHGHLCGVGALKMLGDGHAEIKSMHTRVDLRGRGVGRAIAQRLIELARERGCGRVSLETGTVASFAAAQRLYATLGFERCEPFGQYTSNPYSICMTLKL